MHIFKSKYIVIVNSNIKHNNTFKTNIDDKYQNSSLTLIEMQYENNKCYGIYTMLIKWISFFTITLMNSQ